jgi:exodeoxyribonuclease-3
MRLVVWNCCSGFAADLPALLALEPTVAVVPEAPRAMPTSPPLGSPEFSWAAQGTFDHKSLAVIGFDTAVIDRPNRGDGRWSVAVDVPSFGAGVLGIWATPESTGPVRYVDEVMKAVEEHADWICTGRVVVAGDFNADGQGRAEKASGAFTRLRTKLEEFGLVSAYHHATGESFGAESTPTYFHRRKREAPFHIDFAFVPKPLVAGLQVEVGGFDEWVGAGRSDHVPVIVDLPALSS